MAVFRKKPTTIEAVQIVTLDRRGPDFGDQVMPKWLAQAMGAPSHKLGAVFMGDGYLMVRSPSGIISGSPGDWICCQDAMDIYLVKDSTFREIYDPVVP